MFAKLYSRFYGVFNQEKPYKKDTAFLHKWAEKPKTILDIGCGRAEYWKYWPDGTIVHGVEKSEEMASLSPHKLKITVGDIATIGDSCTIRPPVATFDKLFDSYDAV